MNYLYTSFIVALWLIIQWLTHDSYWFNFIINLICVAFMSNSVFVHYQKSKPKHYTREQYSEAMKAALENARISLLNENEK